MCMKIFSLDKGRSLFLVLLLTLIGCQSQNGNTIPPSTDMVEQAGTIALATPTINRPAATTTPTATEIRVKPTVGSTFTLLPLTPTPTPTLTSEQATAMLTELLQLDSSCPLPCWLGIVPGESQLEPVLNRFKELGFRVGSASAGLLGADKFLVTQDFGSSEGIVTTIKVTGGYDSQDEESLAFSKTFARGWQDYGMKEMLDRYGMPSRAFLFSPYRADPGGGPAYRLYLFYDSQGIVVQYRGSTEQLQGSTYRACFDLNSVWSIELFLYEPDTIDSIIEHILPADSLSYLDEPGEVHDLVEWQQATGMSLEAFYESLQSTEATPCVEFYTPFP